MSKGSKLIRITCALALATGALSMVHGSPADAATVNQCKTLKGTATFTPGISLVAAPQTIKSKGTAGGCTPAKNTGGSGALVATIKGGKPASCQTLLAGGQTLKGTAKTTWKNKKTTAFNIVLKTGTGTKYNIATITGKVTQGLFKGRAVGGQIKFTVKAGQNCTTVPVKALSFVSTKPFVLK